ncbi:putative type II thioesterase [Streptomyces sp. NBRC 110611]|uniref:thioesterase II family protein n=1 Tax=Streptomyces sp. NBRC 110611 TaxID=1621259 RepID=UPI00082DE5AC|nr:thioesterase domain-containing protein [Streptomyces sp. NBRC 110611]GAU70355.1 putative type II thioesterase [Streptomyces sp. NBRC 110611]
MTTAAEPARWLLREPSAEARARIFCFPYSGVGASMFNAWPRWAGGAEICPLQLPGRENRIREPHYGTYEALAEALAGGLAPWLDRPFAFFGHCAGALPAFETARLLAGRRLPVPRRLFVSAQVAPHHCPHDRFLDMTDDQLRAELAHLAVLRGGRPHPALLDLGLAVLREDLGANRGYRLAEPVRVPFGVTVLHWADDPEVTQAQLKGWEHYGDEVRFAVLDGGHYSFLSAPATLLEALSEAVA